MQQSFQLVCIVGFGNSRKETVILVRGNWSGMKQVAGAMVPFFFIAMGTLHALNTTVGSSAMAASGNYVEARLGYAYYSHYVNMSGAYLSGNISYVYFSYNVPFVNGSSVTARYAGTSQVVRNLGISLSVYDNGTVGEYQGPNEPYFVNVSRDAAVMTAGSFGIQNATAILEGGYFGGSQTGPEQGYEIVWAVQSRNPTIMNDSKIANVIYRGVYIGAVNGSLVGEFEYNPAIISPTGNYADLGNMELFSLPAAAGSTTVLSTIPATTVPSQSNGDGVSVSVAAGAVIVLILLSVTAFVLRRRKKI